MSIVQLSPSYFNCLLPITTNFQFKHLIYLMLPDIPQEETIHMLTVWYYLPSFYHILVSHLISSYKQRHCKIVSNSQNLASEQAILNNWVGLKMAGFLHIDLRQTTWGFPMVKVRPIQAIWFYVQSDSSNQFRLPQQQFRSKLFPF